MLDSRLIHQVIGSYETPVALLHLLLLEVDSSLLFQETFFDKNHDLANISISNNCTAKARLGQDEASSLRS